MTDLVVDASVAFKWFVPEVEAEAADLLLTFDANLHAPGFLAVETANAAWKNWKKKLVEEPIVRGVTARLRKVIDVWHADDALQEEALDFALQLEHPVFDCLYLALARQLGCPVVTADKRLLRTAPKGLAVSLADWAQEQK